MPCPHVILVLATVKTSPHHQSGLAWGRTRLGTGLPLAFFASLRFNSFLPLTANREPALSGGAEVESAPLPQTAEIVCVKTALRVRPIGDWRRPIVIRQSRIDCPRSGCLQLEAPDPIASPNNILCPRGLRPRGLLLIWSLLSVYCVRFTLGKSIAF